VDQRRAQPHRGLLDPEDLLDGALPPRARFHRRIVRHHAHRTSGHAPDAGDDAVGWEVAGLNVRQQRVLDERAFIEQQREPVAAEELVLLRRGLVVLGCAASANLFGHLVQVVFGVLTHRYSPRYTGARSSRNASSPSSRSFVGTVRPYISCSSSSPCSSGIAKPRTIAALAARTATGPFDAIPR